VTTTIVFTPSASSWRVTPGTLSGAGSGWPPVAAVASL